MATQKPHVLIIGAGIGGLTLSQSLRKQGVSFEVFERDASPSARGKGFALGLYNPDALFEDALSDDVPPLRSTCHLLPLPLPSQVVLYLGDRKFMVEDTPETPCLRANRLHLRELLATKIQVNWGKEAVRIEEGDDQVTVFFRDGSSATGDIVVGADGVHSGVRPHLLKIPNEEVLNPSPVGAILGEVELRGDVMEQQLQLGHTCFFLINPSYTLFSGVNSVGIDAQGKPFGAYYWVMANLDQGLNSATAQEKLDFARDKVQALASPFRVTVEATTVAGVRERDFGWWDALIPASRLPSVNRVVLIGDACHPMTPNRGEGGIFAIREAVRLGKILGAADRDDYASLRAKLDEFQKDIADKGYESILAARTVKSLASPGAAAAPRVWGYEAKPVDKLKPLPFKFSEWKPE